MNPPSRIDYRFALMLLAMDAAFVFLHVVGLRFFFKNEMLSLYQDGGIPEWFQYMKEFWTFMLLAIAGYRRRSGLLITLSLLFVYFVLDDARQIHEKMGLLLAAKLALQSRLGMPPREVGELLVSGTVAAAFFIPAAIFYLRGSAETRRIARWVVGLTAVLAGFGAVDDAINTIVAIPGGELIEEIGEMLAMTAIVTFAFGLVPPRLAEAE